jgi:hypothetical protein
MLVVEQSWFHQPPGRSPSCSNRCISHVYLAMKVLARCCEFPGVKIWNSGIQWLITPKTGDLQPSSLNGGCRSELNSLSRSSIAAICLQTPCELCVGEGERVIGADAFTRHSRKGRCSVGKRSKLRTAGPRLSTQCFVLNLRTERRYDRYVRNN